MGNVSGTLLALIIMNPEMEFAFSYAVEGKWFYLDTREIKQQIDPLPINTPDVAAWIKDYIKEEILNLHGGAIFQ
jgi:hypothetical protein